MVKTVVKQLCPAAHGGSWGSRDPPAAHRGDPHQTRWMPKRQVDGCETMGSETHAGTGLWQLPADPCGERSPCWSRFSGWICDTVGGPHWSKLRTLAHSHPDGNHRKDEVERDLLTNPLIKQDHLVAQDHVQTGFEYHQGKTAFDPHNPNKTLTGARSKAVSFSIDSSFGGQ
ncbi:hypothetical protein DUI87_15884 [Hirundo rustica rustica]|uniref:Uncharacterized protein n=1 Tax=Hirundo rustica rustica TaxID=333673 RepID=A0A3M0K5U8_HIRRU|nr:hypothetical protein DUI87_15884 [Hirundo rustica rustica]